MGLALLTNLKKGIAKRFAHLFQEIRQELPLAEYILWWVFRAILLGGAVWSIFNRPEETFEMFVALALSSCIPLLHLFCMNLWPGHFPIRMQTVGTFYLFITSFCGSLLELYYILPWWDLVIHMLAGGILVYVGYCVMVALNYKHRPKFGDPSPIVQATWGVGFSAFAELVWEFLEFSFDSITLGDSQHWRVNPNPDFELFKVVTDPALLDYFHVDAGRYALLDTMTDIISGLIGSIIGFIIVLFWLRRRDRLGLLRHGSSDPVERDVPVDTKQGEISPDQTPQVDETGEK